MCWWWRYHSLPLNDSVNPNHTALRDRKETTYKSMLNVRLLCISVHNQCRYHSVAVKLSPDFTDRQNRGNIHTDSLAQHCNCNGDTTVLQKAITTYRQVCTYQWYMIIACIYHRGVTIRRATIRYVSRYVGRDTTNDTISDDTPTNLESQTHFS